MEWGIALKGTTVMRKTRTRLILWFLIIIALTTVVMFFSVSRGLSKQFANFIVSSSDNQVRTIEAFIIEEYNANGLNKNFTERLTQLAQAGKMSVKLTDPQGALLFEYEFENQWKDKRMKMPMHMHREWNDEFEAYWPGTSLTVIRSNTGEQIGLLELELHALDGAAEPAMDFIQNMTKGIIQSVIVAAALSVVLGLIFARTFSKPLNSMTRVAENMRKGDLKQRVSKKQSTDEMKQLAISLNHLSASLEIQQSLRSRLASDLSHELRTPLSVIKSHIEAVRDGIWKMDDRTVNVLLTETERLMNLADQVRFIEDIESHQVKLSKQEIELKSWVNDLVDIFRPEVERQNKTLKVMGESSNVQIDLDKFKQIIINLVTNALQHTQAGDEITIHIRKLGHETLLEVIDTGEGIEKEAIDHVFERLYRSEEARSRVNGGSGLGLSVVKSLVEAHGFEIKVESEVNKGTRMKINMIK